MSPAVTAYLAAASAFIAAARVEEIRHNKTFTTEELELIRAADRQHDEVAMLFFTAEVASTNDTDKYMFHHMALAHVGYGDALPSELDLDDEDDLR